MTRRLWTRDELILSLELYYKLPYKKINSKTQEIISLANLLERTPNSIAIRVTNYISCNPLMKEKGIKGKDGGLAQCQPSWDEFFNNKQKLSLEYTRIIDKLNSQENSKNNNRVIVIDQDIIWSKICDSLKEKYKISYTGSNPYYLNIEDTEYYVFTRNLTRAYPFSSPDVCRIQLHKSYKFDFIKNTKKSLIVLGFCEQFNTIACWSSESIKPRLNSRRNVSLYSRFSQQKQLEPGKFREYKLSNQEIVKIVNLEDVYLLFKDSNLSQSKYFKNTNKIDLFTEFNFEYKNDKFDIDDLYMLTLDFLEDSSEIKVIQICIAYFEKYQKDYDLIKIKNIISKFKTQYNNKKNKLFI